MFLVVSPATINTNLFFKSNLSLAGEVPEAIPVWIQCNSPILIKRIIDNIHIYLFVSKFIFSGQCERIQPSEYRQVIRVLPNPTNFNGINFYIVEVEGNNSMVEDNNMGNDNKKYYTLYSGDGVIRF